MFWHSVIGVSLLKLLAIPSWYDIDLNVHMSWMAITHGLPLDQWYHTGPRFVLDYMPFFAWFEFVLGWFASKFVDPEMLNFEMYYEYNSYGAVAFQRVTVVVTDLSLAYGISVCANALGWDSKRKELLAAMIFTNAGLFMIDHIFFHYTGILQGLLLASIG